MVHIVLIPADLTTIYIRKRIIFDCIVMFFVFCLSDNTNQFRGLVLDILFLKTSKKYPQFVLFGEKSVFGI